MVLFLRIAGFGFSFLIFFLTGLVHVAYGQQFRGQLSGWENVQRSENSDFWFGSGVRYLPEYAKDFTENNPYSMDVEISANLYGTYNSQFDSGAVDLKPYRLWTRFATHKFESRIGLQKINFAPAKLLRSLMWFDRLDPRDPLQLTEGVYALRLRYDFENLSSIWLWGIYGTGDTKGLEFFPTRDQSLEYGGRVGYPVGPGEIALTTHHRTVDPSLHSSPGFQETRIPESRIALDGIWDIGVGVWFETALIHADYPFNLLDWQSFQTAGIDYTFPFGNGLHVLGEHLLVTISDKPFDLSERTQTSGVMASYPIGWLDQIALYSIYNWDAKMAYHYISWQRTYNRWILHTSVFGRTGDADGAFLNQPVTTVGKFGVQLMVIFNH